VSDVAGLLRERASSYFTDSRSLDEDGDSAMAAAYRAIATELRKIAEEVDAARASG
jgi:hypothetical protein